MDAVVLANYANEHAPFAIKLLNSGRHVSSEVLPVQTMSETVHLVEAVENSGKVYTYAENYCYFPAMAEMKRRYQAGDIGEFMHGQGEYVHNCESIWPQITYGEKEYWRNNMYSTFYCTHSIGPIVTITGNRPVRVVGFETSTEKYITDLGYRGGCSGMIFMQMDNGATVKSLHGHLKRVPDSIWYSIYGDKGIMESDRWEKGIDEINIFRDEETLTDTRVSYLPKPRINTELSNIITGHGGSDFYTMYYFIKKILGRNEGKNAIDIYQALDMGIPGILAYRSICTGNMPIEVPNFRIKAEREKYRNDNWCTDKKVAGENLDPLCSFEVPEIPDSTYEKVKEIFKQKGTIT